MARTKAIKADEVNEEEIDTIPENEESDVQPDKEESKSGVSKIIFTIKSTNKLVPTTTRVFDSETHGADFETIAEEFEQSNTLGKITLSKTDPDYVEHEKEVNTRNATIKQHILKKEVE